MLNEGSQAISWYDYDPYGTIWRSTVNKDVAYKFTGQEIDAELGLYNFRAREYDPTLGIFCAADAAGQDFSPYMYCGGNPTMFTDPTGRLFVIDDLIEIGLYVYSAYSAARQAYSTYQAIKSGDAGNIVGALMSDAFTAASLGVGGSGPNGFYASDWAEHIGFAGLESMASYYAAGGKGLIGGLESFGEGAVPAGLSMLAEYDEVSNWQPAPLSNEALSVMPSYDISQGNLTMGTATIQLPQPYWVLDQNNGEWHLWFGTVSYGQSVLYGFTGNGIGLDNPDFEDAQYVGPIPRGTYSIGPMISSHTTSAGITLKYPMELTPADEITQETLASYGRAGFWAHGAASTYDFNHLLGSEGCPILSYQDRLYVYQSGAFTLKVMR